MTETFHPTNTEMTIDGLNQRALVRGPDQDLIAELLLNRQISVRSIAMQEHAGRKEEQLPPAGLVVRASTGDGVLQPCSEREAEGAPELGGGALERECSTAQLRCEIDVVEALEPEAHA